PAVEELEKSGIQAFGPYLADTFFGDALYLDFDGVLAMYDDQGTVPFSFTADFINLFHRRQILKIITVFITAQFIFYTSVRIIRNSI
ncbi:MAG: 4-hydroxythreonine-4-phosphate dehydrogenase PdxA, partial [Bacteroidales bacterium]|nr:4-hydroxythreonine-4-phosphate dehydrogenase PdxA [Bacteroidales bacterium]